MTILYDNALSTKRLPRNHTLLLNSYASPSKLNIKLKTHSLTSLNIPLETFAGLNKLSSSFRNDYQKTMAGSVDLISEIQQQQPNDDTFSHFSPTKPLIKIVQYDEQECRQIPKHRFRMSTSLLTPTSLNDSVARLRRSGYLQNIRQSSLQTIDKITERKQRLSLTHNRSIPKFSFRDLPSTSRPSSINRLEQFPESRMSQFTSLPEIRSFVAQNCFDNLETINDKFKLPPSSTSPSWTKSGSWSWKSNNAMHFNALKNERIKSNITQKEPQHHINDHTRFELPVIIESPLQQRSSQQAINKHRSNLSFRSDQMQQNSSRLYQKKNSFPHSVSNYEVSSNRFSSQPTTRYPSTPLLSYSRHKNIEKFDYHSSQLHMSPIATFDDDDDESDSISSTSSFRSCIDSIDEYSDMNTTESTSSLLEESFQELSSSYDLPAEISDETIKYSRSSVRHFCTVQ